jgi:hypothetical protein
VHRIQNSTESFSTVLPDVVLPYELLQPVPVAKLNRALELAIGVHPSHPLDDAAYSFRASSETMIALPSFLGSSRTVHHLGPSGQDLTRFAPWSGRRCWRLKLV